MIPLKCTTIHTACSSALASSFLRSTSAQFCYASNTITHAHPYSPTGEEAIVRLIALATRHSSWRLRVRVRRLCTFSNSLLVYNCHQIPAGNLLYVIKRAHLSRGGKHRNEARDDPQSYLTPTSEPRPSSTARSRRLLLSSNTLNTATTHSNFDPVRIIRRELSRNLTKNDQYI